MIVRRCRVEDADEIYKIEAEAFENPIKKETFIKDLKRDDYYCFAAFDGEARAFISYERVLDEGQIISVATCKEYRRRGLSKMIFSHILERAREDKTVFFTLEVRSDNLPAVSLYEKMGFKKVGLRKNYYENPAGDAVLMDLHIGDD